MLVMWLVALVLVLPSAALAVDKDVVRLQRDVAFLHEDVRQLRNSIDKSMHTLVVLVQKAIDRVSRVQQANSITQRTLVENRQQRQEKIEELVVTLEKVRADCAAMKNSALDVNARLEAMERELSEVSNAVRIIRSPPPPPSVSERLGGPPEGLSAEGLFQMALGNKTAGNYDQAAREFQDLLRYFGNIELAASAQFHLGDIAFRKHDWKTALEAFDLVIETYPRSGKAADALHMKAKVLQKQGRRRGAAQAIAELLREYPNSDAANHAQAERKRLGSTPQPSRK